jgi:hypothetical protein
LPILIERGEYLCSLNQILSRAGKRMREVNSGEKNMEGKGWSSRKPFDT